MRALSPVYALARTCNLPPSHTHTYTCLPLIHTHTHAGEATLENAHGRTRQSVEELMAKDKIKKGEYAAHIHTHEDKHIDARAHTHAHTRTHTHTRAHTRTHARTLISTHAHTHVHTCTQSPHAHKCTTFTVSDLMKCRACQRVFAFI